jgi:hypothetical protein
VLLFGLTASACNSTSSAPEGATDQITQQQEIQKAAAALVEQARLKAKNDVLRDPAAFLEVKDSQSHDKGIINSYRQLTQIAVLNHSTVPVQDISGDVEWLNESGERQGSVPFRTRGSIAAGATAMFSQANGTLSNGTLETAANKFRLKISHVSVVE